MDKMTKLYDNIKEAVEKVAGRKMCTPRDFDFLVGNIFDVTAKKLSPTTLKRFWGYLNLSSTYKPLKFTLDTLALYVGYKNWEAFCNQSSAAGNIESDPVKSDTLYSTSLKAGDRITIVWNPDRNITVRHLGEDLFVIEKSANSKLLVGDRFCCGIFIQNEALYLSRLTRGEEVLGAYICGRKTGINYRLVLGAGNAPNVI